MVRFLDCQNCTKRYLSISNITTTCPKCISAAISPKLATAPTPELLKKLSKLKNPLSSPQSTVSLSQTAALPTNTHTTDKLTPGPKLKKLKEEKRKRDSERISKENLIILKRLQSVRPEYSAEKFRKSQKSHHQCLKLRRTDYTAGHIVTQVSPQSSFHLIAPHRTAPHPPTHKLTTNNK